MSETKIEREDRIAGERRRSGAPLWIPTLLAMLLVVTLLLGIDNSRDLRNVVEANVDSQKATCERLNVARQNSIKGLRNDIKGLKALEASMRADLDIIRGATVSSGYNPILENGYQAKRGTIKEIDRVIHGKQLQINGALLANAPVAVRKNSPISDCEKVVEGGELPGVPVQDRG